MKQRTIAVAAALVLACLATTTIGCGTRFAYNHADDLVQRRIERSLDTTDEQESWLDRRLAEVHAWHREHELPRYVAFLRDARARAADGLTAEEVASLHERVIGFYRSLVRRVLPHVEAFLPRLSDRQLKHWAIHAKERLDDREEDLDVPSDERREDRLDTRRDALEDWIGDLTDRQEAMLAKQVASTPDRAPERLRRDRERTAKLLRLLRADEHDEAEAALERWFLEEPVGGSPKAHARLRGFLVELDASLTEEQRAHLLEEIDDWIEVLEDLSP
ncbi:MAG: DUF6279 family lipoprotein [Myxococcota bacterium]